MDLTQFEGQPKSFLYRMLSRMRSDCEYYLGYGGRAAKHLWAGNEKDQIAYMKAIWGMLDEKPEWLTAEDIINYEKQMIQSVPEKAIHINESDMNSMLKRAEAKLRSQSRDAFRSLDSQIEMTSQRTVAAPLKGKVGDIER